MTAAAVLAECRAEKRRDVTVCILRRPTARLETRFARETAIIRTLLQPFHHTIAAIDAALPESPLRGVWAAGLGLVVVWFIYVPVHELLHVAGCLVFGGTVDTLQVKAIYGGHLLARIFSFVEVGGDYAGRLTGFDTRGSDLCYLATVFAPYLLTVLVGVPVLRAVAVRGKRGALWSFVLGGALPVALAPFTNLFGDYYELGSIVVSRVADTLGVAGTLMWRTDDPLGLVGSLRGAGEFGFGDGVGLVLGLLVGVILAFATYRCGAWLSSRLPFER